MYILNQFIIYLHLYLFIINRKSTITSHDQSIMCLLVCSCPPPPPSGSFPPGCCCKCSCAHSQPVWMKSRTGNAALTVSDAPVFFVTSPVCAHRGLLQLRID